MGKSYYIYYILIKPIDRPTDRQPIPQKTMRYLLTYTPIFYLNTSRSPTCLRSASLSSSTDSPKNLTYTPKISPPFPPKKHPPLQTSVPPKKRFLFCLRVPKITIYLHICHKSRIFAFKIRNSVSCFEPTSVAISPIVSIF